MATPIPRNYVRNFKHGIGEGSQETKRAIVEELHKAARRNFSRRHVTIKGLNDLYQADLVEMRPYARENNGYNYLLTMIDTFSKRAWAFPIKTKTGTEIAHTLESFFASIPHTPKFLQVDQGSEFYNKKVENILKGFGINLYSSFSPLKATIVERFNRTLKTWMWKEFSVQGSYKWITLIDNILKKYNQRTHRAIGMPPIDVSKKNEKTLLAMLNRKPLPPRRKNKFKVGDPVRISKFKHIFEKGYTPNWTTEVFNVHEIHKTRPLTYRLKDLNGEIIRGGFYEEELQKTKFKDTYLIEKILKRKKR